MFLLVLFITVFLMDMGFMWFCFVEYWEFRPQLLGDDKISV